MKKKTLAFILAAAMALTLAACGGSPAESSAPTPTPANDTPAPESSAPVAPTGGSVYTTTINDAEVKFTISDDQKSIVVDAMGMTVEGTCEVADNVLTFKEQTSGNAQIWTSLGANSYTLNDDGTATAAGASGQEPGGNTPADAEELFAWEGYAALVFNTDGTYDFNYNDMVKESGTWKWENWKLTVTDANGTEMAGAVDKEDNNTLKFEFTAVANSQLVVNFTAASDVWGPALGMSGTYTPAGGGTSAPAAGGVERFAGEYDLYSEEKDLYCEEFVIDEDGTVHGVVESSGLTAFEGTVSEDGTITAEVSRLGGTMNGTITDDLQITVKFEVRGSTSEFVGGPL